VRSEPVDGTDDDDPDHSDGIDDGGEQPERPKLKLAAPRSGPTPKRKASNATALSRTDPDAKLRYKPGHRPHLVHRAQVVTDPKRRVIVAVHAEPATGHEADSLAIIIDRAKWLRHRVSEIVADAGYASAAVYLSLEQRGITAYIPPQPNMRQAAHGHAARARCKTPTGVTAAIDRITHGEGAIAEMKRHGAGRARCRGTRKLQIQLLLAATAINLKRLIYTDPAADNADTGPDHAQAQARDRDRSERAAITAHLRIIRACLHALSSPTTTTSTTGS
jgi:Transposase DDE domain